MQTDDFAWLDEQETSPRDDSFGWLEDDQPIEIDAVLTHPVSMARRVEKRRTLIAEKEQNLAKLITSLPPPDTDLFIIGTADGREHGRTGHITHGSFDFGSFVGVCLDMLLTETRAASAVLYVSTWVLNRDTVQMFRDNLDAGRLSALHFLGDKFLKRRHTAAIYAQLVELVQSHPPSRIRLTPNHVKALCLSVPGRCVTITGSANLSAVARTEQYNLSTAPDVHAFYIQQFFEPIFAAKGNREHASQ